MLINCNRPSTCVGERVIWHHKALRDICVTDRLLQETQIHKVTVWVNSCMCMYVRERKAKLVNRSELLNHA